MIHRTLYIALVAALGLTLAACATTKEEPVEQPAEPQAAAPAPAPAAAPAPTNMISYEVQRGDHLWGIARQPRIDAALLKLDHDRKLPCVANVYPRRGADPIKV